MFINKLIKRLYRYKEDINKEEIFSIMKKNPGTILLDVRSPQEYKEGHLQRSN